MNTRTRPRRAARTLLGSIFALVLGAPMSALALDPVYTGWLSNEAVSGYDPQQRRHRQVDTAVDALLGPPPAAERAPGAGAPKAEEQAVAPVSTAPAARGEPTGGAAPQLEGEFVADEASASRWRQVVAALVAVVALVLLVLLLRRRRR